MNKRIIDADALDKLIEQINESTFSIGTYDVLYASNLLFRIYELSTPAPVAQEGIFDKDDWCREFEEISNYLHEANTDDAYVLVCLQGYKTPLPALYSEIGDSDCRATYELFAIDIVKDDAIIVDKNNFIAWQPLPKISTRGEL